EIKNYIGPLKAKNFEIFRDSLAEHGMLGQWRDFLHASGQLLAPARLPWQHARIRPTRLAQLGAKVLKSDSEDREGGHAAACAFDGDTDTFWHTRAQDPGPHYLVIELGREVTLRGVTCLPRQDRAEGRVVEVEALCS